MQYIRAGFYFSILQVYKCASLQLEYRQLSILVLVLIVVVLVLHSICLAS